MNSEKGYEGKSSRAPMAKSGNARLVILGAGRPFRGEQHSALRGASNTGRVLDWLLRAVDSLQPDVHFVGGYRVEDVAQRYPSIQYTVNAEWETTGAAASLLAAPLECDSECYVSYADILFRESVVREIAAVEADIVVAVDSEWRRRFDGRLEQDLVRCEKVNVHDGLVTRLGSDLLPELADAEFVGFVRLSPEVTSFLRARADSLPAEVSRGKLSQLLELVRARGFLMRAVDVAGDWAELNEPRDIAHFILGTKAQTLDRLQTLVRRSRIQDQVSFTVGDWNRSAITVIRHVRQSFVDGRLVVRSSALSEDGFATANAGAYASILNVDSSRPRALQDAINGVVASYRDENPAIQVLVQPMVDGVQVSGVVFTRTLAHGAPYYVINYDDTTRSTDSITNGSSREHKTLVIHRGSSTDSGRIPVVVRDLLPAVQEIEQLLDYDSLDMEFAIDVSGRVNILQVRPIAVDHDQWDASDEVVNALLNAAQERFKALQRPSPFVKGARAFFGVMPDWNPAEIIGTKPGCLAMGLYRYLIMDEVWATQRAEYGYRDVRPQPLLVAFAGHPYVDIRASFNSFVPASVDDGLAERLVDFYLGWLERFPHLHDKVEFDVVPTCFGLDFNRWRERLIIEGEFSDDEVEVLRKGLVEITRRALKRNPQDLKAIDELEQRRKKIMQADVSPLERAVALLEDCRRHGTLAFSHLARSAFVAITLLRSAVSTHVIAQRAMDSFLNSIRTVTHRLTADATATALGQLSWDEFVARYGHLRPGTYDVTSPCYAEDAEHFLRPIVKRVEGKAIDQTNESPWREAREQFAGALNAAGLPGGISDIEHFMRNAIEGREYAKFAFTRNLSAALDCLKAYGETLGLTREDISNISLESFFSLRTGGIVTSDVAECLRTHADEGARARRMARVIELPPLLLSEDDFRLFMYPNNQPNFIGNGRVTAECVDLETGSSKLPPDLTGKIAMIPQADPGYDWLFGQGVAGLITMYGGANSHMAIRAAEFGLPAAIGIGETEYSRLSSASALDLDAGNRRIQVIQ